MKFAIPAIFLRPTVLEVAARELIEAQHAKLEAQTAAEYANAVVTYNTQRIDRLLAFISGGTSGGTKTGAKNYGLGG